MALGVSRNLIVLHVDIIGTLATDACHRGHLEVQTVFPTTVSRCGWREAFADILVYQRHVETLDGAGGGADLEVGQALVVGAVVVHAEQGVVRAEPVGVVLVDALATDLQLYVLQQLLGAVEGGARAGQHELDHDVGDQVTVTGNLSAHLISKAHRSVDGLLDRLDGEVGVPAVYSFEKRDLRISGQVHVLSSIGYEL